MKTFTTEVRIYLDCPAHGPAVEAYVDGDGNGHYCVTCVRGVNIWNHPELCLWGTTHEDTYAPRQPWESAGRLLNRVSTAHRVSKPRRIEIPAGTRNRSGRPCNGVCTSGKRSRDCRCAGRCHGAGRCFGGHE